MIAAYLATSVSKGRAALAFSGSEGGFPNNRNPEAPERTMTRRVVFIASAWVSLARAGVAQTLVLPELTGRVVDEAGLLSAADRAALTGSLADLEAKTTDQLVVVTLKSLQGTSIDDYGYRVGGFWQIDQKDKGSDALLIVAASEQKVRIEVGHGLEGTLTGAATKLIIENSILPKFKTGDFSGGIKSGVGDIIQLLGGDAAGATRTDASSPR